MRILLFGPPGAGKGTQASLLRDRHSLKHLSTGDMFRAAMKAETSIGLEAKSYIHAGKLVPDEVTWKIAKEALEAIGAEDFILDGYPRTIQQADWLHDYLANLGKPLDAVVSLEVPNERIINRLSRRRMHTETGEIYHLDFNPPPADVPAELIMQRKDDVPEAIAKRLNTYDEQTSPLKNYFEEKGALCPVDGVGDIEEIYGRIQTTLTERNSS